MSIFYFLSPPELIDYMPEVSQGEDDHAGLRARKALAGPRI